jgi:hypothetical protein
MMLKMITPPKMGATSRMFPPIVFPTMEIAGPDCLATSSTTSSASSAASTATLAAAISIDCAPAMSNAHVAARTPDLQVPPPGLLPRSMGSAVGAKDCSQRAPQRASAGVSRATAQWHNKAHVQAQGRRRHSPLFRCHPAVPDAGQLPSGVCSLQRRVRPRWDARTRADATLHRTTDPRHLPSLIFRPPVSPARLLPPPLRARSAAGAARCLPLFQ